MSGDLDLSVWLDMTVESNCAAGLQCNITDHTTASSSVLLVCAADQRGFDPAPHSVAAEVIQAVRGVVQKLH